MKKPMICTAALLALLCLLSGCAKQSLEQLFATSPTEATAAPTRPAPTAPAKTEPAATEPAPIETTAPVATTEPAETEPAPETVYRQEGDVFTNDVLEIWLENGRILCKELASGTEQILFAPEQPSGTTLELIGVTDDRLYFGWNEEEDWWGVNVYSVDHAGQSRKEYGEAWDPFFEGGWLLLFGFRSDVSPTELLIIDRRDETVVEELNGVVWDGKCFNGSFYYIYISDAPESIEDQLAMTDVTYEIIRLDPDNTSTVVYTQQFDSFYHPAPFGEDGTASFYDESFGNTTTYDLFP